MVRTKDQVGIKVGGKSSKVSSRMSRVTENFGNDKGKSSQGGGNSYCPRETPSWQKEITKFFGQPSTLKVRIPKSSTQVSSSSQVVDKNEKQVDESDSVPESVKIEDKENNDPADPQNVNRSPEIDEEKEQNETNVNDDTENKIKKIKYDD